MGNFENIVDGGRDFVCGLYKQQPRALIPNLGETALRFAWDKLCGEPPKSPSDLPAPPTSPFTGGQCDAVPYLVRTSVNVIVDGVTYFTDIGEYVYFGPISGIGLSGNAAVLYCRGASGSPPQPSGTVVKLYEVGAGASLASPAITSIRKQDGSADNCGDPPGAYPPAPPTPPGGFVSPPVNLTLNDGLDITVNFRLTPPTPPSKGNPPPPIKVEVESPNFSFPISFNFNGDVNIGSPPSIDIDLPDNVTESITNINNNTTNLQTNFNDFRKDYDFVFYPPSFVNNPDVDVVVGEEEQEGEKDKDSLLGLKVVLSNVPDKAQFGTPNVYFAGWITFKTEQGYMPRQQINFESSYFIAPPGSTGYGYTFTNGSRGVVTEYSRKEEPN